MGRNPTDITINDVRLKAKLRARKFYKIHKKEIIKKRKELKSKNICEN